jgi:hypothetical protein
VVLVLPGKSGFVHSIKRGRIREYSAKNARPDETTKSAHGQIDYEQLQSDGVPFNPGDGELFGDNERQATGTSRNRNTV